MAKKITATDIKAKVLRTLKAYGRKLNDKNVPHYFNEATSRMAIDEAKAYLTDPDYIVAPAAVKAIENWCANIKYY